MNKIYQCYLVGSDINEAVSLEGICCLQQLDTAQAQNRHEECGQVIRLHVLQPTN